MNQYLINALRDGRLRKGLKQSEVAEMIGVKGGTLSNYENGISEPDIDTFASLCEIYDLDYAFVLGEAYGLGVQGSDFSIKPSEIEYIKKYRDLDDHGRETVDIILDRESERTATIRDLKSKAGIITN
ncbi:MAG: helix-turn-helix transcriptional regulator, partial [Clostridium sp.]|nr:helix-turn-helix transcriptional regulator [Clostridium sp.]